MENRTTVGENCTVSTHDYLLTKEECSLSLAREERVHDTRPTRARSPRRASQTQQQKTARPKNKHRTVIDP
eukprot:scaffold286_cov52-Attheya_sp.AAC.4